ncbi:MAG: cation transporter [Clostridia bacterium]|nr:cation transporter [Clostridia bacterium]
MNCNLSYAQKTVRISAVGLIGNIFLSVLKFSGGILSNCGSLISDGIHSAADILGNIIIISGLWLSGKSGKKRFNFNREKFEYIASAIIGFFLLVTGIFIGISALVHIIKGDFGDAETPTPLALIIAIIALAVKEFLFRFTYIYAAKYDSKALLADAYHHRSDVFSTLGALIGVLVSRIGFPIMDKIASLGICILICKAALDILKDSLKEITDKDYEI